ncbi:MAG: MBOAT family protein [Clostridia bacterium]|nr:MBOAT family protein [Clostridia bacterium]
MLFSSIPFLYYFLPCVLLLYLIAPKKLKNAVLFLTSLVFYAWGEPKFVVIMLISVTVGYLSGLLLEKYRQKKWLLFLSVAIPLAFLLYFKYADFFIANFAAATGLSIPLLRVTLPIGISFYTFQIVSYQVDVYRGAKAQKNPIHLGAFIALFPQLIAGPIVRYVDIEKELENRTHSAAMIAEGIRRFCIGLGKKILIANTLATLAGLTAEAAAPSVLLYWVCALASALQIYFDFSGYSDMAIGLGKVFGFHFLENFNYPLISRSVAEFWRRWHMSLGSWFRDYVYIPMGGNRVGKGRWVFNILVVWMLTGFWHGAEWTFILWGLFFAVFLVLEKWVLGKFLQKYRVLSHGYVALLVLVSFTIFGSGSLPAMVESLGAMFGLGGLPLVTAETVYYLKSYAILLVIALVGSTPLMKHLALKLPEKIRNIGELLYAPAVLTACTAFLVDGAFNPFLYFRF